MNYEGSPIGHTEDTLGLSVEHKIVYGSWNFFGYAVKLLDNEEICFSMTPTPAVALC